MKIRIEVFDYLLIFFFIFLCNLPIVHAILFFYLKEKYEIYFSKIIIIYILYIFIFWFYKYILYTILILWFTNYFEKIYKYFNYFFFKKNIILEQTKYKHTDNIILNILIFFTMSHNHLIFNFLLKKKKIFSFKAFLIIFFYYITGHGYIFWKIIKIFYEALIQNEITCLTFMHIWIICEIKNIPILEEKIYLFW